MQITKDQIEKGHRDYQYYLNGRSGSFYTSLFETIELADINNLNKLAQVYPGLVYAYADYMGKLKFLNFEEV